MLSDTLIAPEAFGTGLLAVSTVLFALLVGFTFSLAVKNRFASAGASAGCALLAVLPFGVLAVGADEGTSFWALTIAGAELLLAAVYLMALVAQFDHLALGEKPPRE